MKIRKYEFALASLAILIGFSFLGGLATFLHKTFYNANRPVDLPASMYQQITDFITPRVHGAFFFCLGLGIGVAIMLVFYYKITDMMWRRKQGGF